MARRLGLDMGTSSIGWAALELEDGRPCELIDAGVRIFPDSRDPRGESLAAARRGPRSARRNRDRYIKRRTEFMDKLVQHGLMPTEESERKALEKLDPWILRARGLNEALTPHEFGRALFHLQQRRGFKSNRKTDRAENEKGAVAEGTARTLERLKEEGARTIGELFGRRRIEAAQRNATLPKGHREPQPSARVSPYFQGSKLAYDYYPTRALIRAEFEALWDAQEELSGDPSLTVAARDDLSDTLFFQRELKPRPVGKCTLDPTQPRAPRALPTVQRLRVYQEANHLQVRMPGEAAIPLDPAQRDLVATKLLGAGKVAFSALRKTLKLPADSQFNLESDKRTHLLGDQTAAVLAAQSRWGKAWRSLSLDEQDEVLERLLEEESEDTLVAWLMTTHGLPEETAKAVADAPLPDGHSALCREASGKILKALADPNLTYDKAVQAAGYQSHSQLDHHGEVLDKLPYYGQLLERHVAFGTGDPDDPPEKRYGKVANPTVHVALNQLRRVVNALIDRFGAPDEIVVELARDLPLSAQGRRDLERRQKANQVANDKRRAVLAEHGQPDHYENRLRLRLWEELNPENPLDRRCPFTGEQISIARLFSDEGGIEIEHILPKSRTLDDSPANKTLCTREANRVKREQSPHEAFGDSQEGFDWDAITDRVASLPASKAWRFAPDAMERFENEERDCLDRQLHSTQYIARLTANYLVWAVGNPAKVHVTPGRLTSDLRHHWGLNSILAGHNSEEAEAVDVAKNRNDHRHHAIDAVVVALTDRPLLKKLATEAGRDDVKPGRLIADLAPPWEGFRDRVAEVMAKTVVSHKPDHGVQGALHNDTAYGIASEPDKGGRREVVHRVPLASLDSAKKLDQIRDDVLRDHFLAATDGLSGRAFHDALVAAGEAMSPPVRKVRIVERLRVIPIRDATGCAYKAYKGDGNYCYDIYPDAKGKWVGEVVSRFGANQPSFNPQVEAGSDSAPLAMRVRNGDLIEIEHDGRPKIMRVIKMSTGRITLGEHFEGGPLKARDLDPGDTFEYLTCSPSRLQQLKARQVHVTPAGKPFSRPTT